MPTIVHNKVIIPKLNDYQREFLDSKHTYTLMLCGRGVGKTYTGAIKIITSMLNGNNILVLGVTFQDIEDSLVKTLFDDVIPAMNIPPNMFKYKKKDHKIINVKNGTTCYIRSDEKPDSSRGLSNISMIIVDEAAKQSKLTFLTALPVMRGRNKYGKIIDEAIGTKQIYFLTTPRKGTWLKPYLSKSNCLVIKATPHQNKFAPGQVETLLDAYAGNDALIRQEIYGEIVDDYDGICAEESLTQKYKPVGNMRVLSIDVAATGEDCTVVMYRIGNTIVTIEKERQSTLESIHHLVDKIIRMYDIPDYIIIDKTGLGAFVPEYLSTRVKCGMMFGINFSGMPKGKYTDRYANNRAFIYGRLQAALKQGVNLPDNQPLRDQLMATKFEIDVNNKFKLPPKKEVKKITGTSPDEADGLALSFAIYSDNLFSHDDSYKLTVAKLLSYKYFTGGRHGHFET